MEGNLFFSGLLIGFAIAAPVGPIGVLCIKRTLSEGRLAGLATGLGAATADALYGLVAGLGITSVSSLLVEGQGWVRLLGGLFLLYLGVRTFLSAPATSTSRVGGGDLLRLYTSTFALTLSNPATILSFVAVFAGVGVAAGVGESDVLWLVAAVFLGSAAWWLLLVGLVGGLRTRVGVRWLGWVNRGSGVVIGGFGVAALLSLLA